MLENIYSPACLIPLGNSALSPPSGKDLISKSLLFACFYVHNNYAGIVNFCSQRLLHLPKTRFERLRRVVASALPDLKKSHVLQIHPAYVKGQNASSERLSKNTLESSTQDKFEFKFLQWLEDPLAIGDKETAMQRIIAAKKGTFENLNLEGLKLNRLPEEICEIDHLKTLNLRNNLLRTIPLNIAKMQNLKTLDCSKNAIIDLPLSLLDIKTIRRLDLSENRLIDLPNGLLEKLKNLRILNIAKNKITDLPKDFEQAKNLIFFDCRDNELLYLPFSIEKAKKLRVLYCKGNDICLRGNFMQSFPQLFHLDLDYHKDGHMFYSRDDMPLPPKNPKVFLRKAKNL